MNLGLDHDWSIKEFKGVRSDDIMPPEDYTSYLKPGFYGNESKVIDNEPLLIPKKANGDDYILEELNPEQQTIVICDLEALIKFLTNDESYKPLCATIIGCGGTGKSHIVNTLISIVRRYTNCNDTIWVASPTGGAAYNIGGFTIHRCLNLSVEPKVLVKSLDPYKQADLARKIENMLMLIIDERSMISSIILAAAEKM